MKEESSNSSKWLWITLVIVILIGVVFFVWIYQQNMMNAVVTNPTVSTIIPSADPTTNWKTYTFKDSVTGKSFYSFKYPVKYTNNFVGTAVGVIEIKDVITFELSGGVQENKDIASYTAELKRLAAQNISPELKTIDVTYTTKTYGENIAYFIKDMNKDPKNIIGDMFDNKGEHVSFSYNPSIVDQTEIDQIISTFKFTDLSATTATSTASWKTYTNSQNGYSIKYPTGWVTKDDNNCKLSTTTSQFACAQYISSYKYQTMSGQDIVADNPKDSPNGFILSINVFSNPKNLSLIDYVTGKSGLNHSGFNEQKISINGNDFLKEDVDGSTSYYTMKGNEVIWLSDQLFNKNYQTMPQSDSANFQADFSTMLSTFQFTK